MQNPDSPLLRWRLAIFFLVGALVVFADQLTKTWILSNVPLGYVYSDYGVFRIVHAHNTGAAFGIFPGHSSILIAIAFIGIVVIIFSVFLSRRFLPVLDGKLGMLSLGLVLGGTAGNLVDRLLRDGYVTDFIDFRFWPIFNVADSSVSIGIVTIAYLLLRLAFAPEE